MLVSFEEMPDHSRLWIYQSERKLTQDEQQLIQSKTSSFIKKWTAHGNELKSAFDILHDQFLVITLDESLSQASGCSIDASVHHVMQLQNELGISLLNNSKIAFMIDDQVQLLPVNGLKDGISKNTVQPETKVFNNTVSNLGEFRVNWLTESNKTWINRYFN